MRSELVFGATKYVPNRYLLTRLAAKATRRFHRPNARIEDTTNEVLGHFSRANPIGGGRGLLASAQMTREPRAGLCDLAAAKREERSAKTGVSTSWRDFEIGKAELHVADAKRNARMRSLVAFGWKPTGSAGDQEALSDAIPWLAPIPLRRSVALSPVAMSSDIFDSRPTPEEVDGGMPLVSCYLKIRYPAWPHGNGHALAEIVERTGGRQAA